MSNFDSLRATIIADTVEKAKDVTFGGEFGGTVSGEITDLTTEATKVYASNITFKTLTGKSNVAGNFVILDFENPDVAKSLNALVGNIVSEDGKITYLSKPKVVELVLTYFSTTVDGKIVTRTIPKATARFTGFTYQTDEESPTMEGIQVEVSGMEAYDEEALDYVALYENQFEKSEATEMKSYLDALHFPKVTPPVEGQ